MHKNLKTLQLLCIQFKRVNHPFGSYSLFTFDSLGCIIDLSWLHSSYLLTCLLPFSHPQVHLWWWSGGERNIFSLLHWLTNAFSPFSPFTFHHLPLCLFNRMLKHIQGQVTIDTQFAHYNWHPKRLPLWTLLSARDVIWLRRRTSTCISFFHLTSCR